MLCNLCPRKCNKERTQYIGKGFCNVGLYPKVARIAPHMGEEPVISGEKGSGAIFFSSCNLRCNYCQNYEISSCNKGEYITTDDLAAEIIRLETIGVHNIDFITGSHYVDAIKETLDKYRPKVPVIYNTSAYDDIEALKKLNGYIDVYLPDFKYSDNELSKKYSSCDNYLEICISSIEEMIKQRGKILIEDGLVKKGVIIRHLVLPNHTKNSIEVLNIIKEHFGNDVMVSLMSQYTPCYKAINTDLNRPITKREYEKVCDEMIRLDLDGFTQELSSSDIKYIPNWDYGTDKSLKEKIKDLY